MDSLIDRVANGRIFKQFVNYVYGRKDATMQSGPRSVTVTYFQDAQQDNSPSLQLTAETESAPVAESPLQASEISAQQSQSEHFPLQRKDSNRNNLTSRLPHFSTLEVDISTKPTLTAKYPQLFTFLEKDGEAGTGVSMTKAMVWQF